MTMRLRGYRRLWNSAVLLSIWFVLGGCGVGTRPSVHTFLLDGEIPAERSAIVSGGARSGTLLVNMPKAKAGFDTPKMAYSVREYQVEYFAVNQWADSPSRMIHPLLVRALDRAGLWRAVVQMPSGVPGDYRLDTDTLELRHIFIQTPSRVQLTGRMQLVDLRDQRLIGSREFDVVQQAPSDDPYGGVVAANRAVAILLEQVVDWVAACMMESVSGRC